MKHKKKILACKIYLKIGKHQVLRLFASKAEINIFEIFSNGVVLKSEDPLIFAFEVITFHF